MATVAGYLNTSVTALKVNLAAPVENWITVLLCAAVENDGSKHSEKCKGSRGRACWRLFWGIYMQWDDNSVVRLWLESRNCLFFQPDNGTQRKVVLLHLYKTAANDPYLQLVKPVAISAYGGSRLLDCKLVDNKFIWPILEWKVCPGTKHYQVHVIR